MFIMSILKLQPDLEDMISIKSKRASFALLCADDALLKNRNNIKLR